MKHIHRTAKNIILKKFCNKKQSRGLPAEKAETNQRMFVFA